MRRALLVLAALLPLAAGCGSGGDHRLSREEYARRGDAICRRYNAATAALGFPTSMPALARIANGSLPPLDRALRELRRLRPPEDEGPAARIWLRQLALLRRDVVLIRDNARANDANGVRRVVPAATRQNRRFLRLARRLGMTVCGSSR